MPSTHMGLEIRKMGHAFAGHRVFLRGEEIGRVSHVAIGRFHAIDKYHRDLGPHTSVRAAAEHVARDVKRVHFPKPHVAKIVRPRNPVITPRLKSIGFALRKY